MWRQDEYHYSYHYAYRPEVDVSNGKILVKGNEPSDPGATAVLTLSSEGPLRLEPSQFRPRGSVAESKETVPDEGSLIGQFSWLLGPWRGAAARPARRRDGSHARLDDGGPVAPHEHGRNGNVATQLVDVRNVVARSAGLTPGGSFNFGTADDFRVPDLGFYRDPTPHSYYPTAALVIEIMSPRDETRPGGALASSATTRREPDAAARRAGPSPAWQLGGARSGDCTVGRPLWPRIRTCRRG